MKAFALEYRLRYWIHVVIYTLGFTVPWNYWLHLDTVRTWQWLAAATFRAKWMGFSGATVAILIAGIVFAFAGAMLRTWGSAYIGASVVQDGAMHGDRVIAAGPYRRMRNPLYVGTFLHTLALALLMLPSGSAFTIVMIAIVQIRLILAEEAFLAEQQGEPYKAYCSLVPRLLPSLSAKVADSGGRAAWGTAFLGEIYMWGVFVSFAALGWMYNSMLILQGVVVSLGVSLVARAFIPKR